MSSFFRHIQSTSANITALIRRVTVLRAKNESAWYFEWTKRGAFQLNVRSPGTNEAHGRDADEIIVRSFAGWKTRLRVRAWQNGAIPENLASCIVVGVVTADFRSRVRVELENVWRGVGCRYVACLLSGVFKSGVLFIFYLINNYGSIYER